MVHVRIVMRRLKIIKLNVLRPLLNILKLCIYTNIRNFSLLNDEHISLRDFPVTNILLSCH